jgi:hypothetical protein
VAQPGTASRAERGAGVEQGARVLGELDGERGAGRRVERLRDDGVAKAGLALGPAVVGGTRST